MAMDPLSVVLTNVCNQSCSFCFARNEMASSIKKEMSLDQFKLVLEKSKKANVNLLYLLGGEPTLHSKFPEILELASKQILFIRIFTNGIFSEAVKKSIIKLGRRVHLIVNISTPGFKLNKKISDLVLKNIAELTESVHVSVSITDNFFSDADSKWLIDRIHEFSPTLLKKLGIKIGFIMPIAGDKNLFKIEDFPKVGDNIIRILKYIEILGPAKMFTFNSGFVPCMFTAEQRKILKKHGNKFLVSCHASNDLYHVTSSGGELSSYKCYPLNDRETYEINEKSDFKEMREHFDKIHQKQIREYVLDKCKTCPFFGYSEGKCSGPCLSFRMNAIREMGQPDIKH